MENTAISFEDVSKRYFIGQYSIRTLHDELEQLFFKIFGRSKKEFKKEIWAINNVSFNIAKGESVGLIGQNGSGKTTIFKLVSRITPPTAGRIRVNGRLGSLIDLYSGFHPELTGIENIYLVAAIRGMKRKEIKRHIDDIIHFAEMDRFKDIPVKHYSAGMAVRLSFSVAVHCPFEILLIDEFVVVGDVGFKNKCFDKIAELQKTGKTIFFVSHDMEKVKKVCSRVIYLSSGTIVMDGNVSEVIDRYMMDMSHNKT